LRSDPARRIPALHAPARLMLLSAALRSRLQNLKTTRVFLRFGAPCRASIKDLVVTEQPIDLMIVLFGAAFVALALGVAVRAVLQKRSAERALAASESMLAKVQRMGNTGSWQWDVRSNTITWSAEIYRIFGMDPKTKATQKAYLERIHADDRDGLVAAIQRATFEGVQYNVRHRIVRPNGEVRSLTAQGEMQFSSAGEPLAMFGITQDVTELVRLQDESDEQRHRLRAVLDNMFTFVGLMSIDGVLIEANRAAVEGLGLARDDVIGKGLWETPYWSYSPEIQVQAREAIARAATGEIVRGDYVVRAEGDRYLTVDVIFGPLRDRDGRIVQVLGSAVDVSERVDAERASRNIRERLEHAQQIANIGSWEWDFRTGELAWSDQCYRIVGWDADGSKPTFERFMNSVHPDDRAQLQTTINGATSDLPIDYDHRVVLANGEVRVVHQIGEVQRDEAGRPLRLVGTTQDVTELRAIEAELRQSQGTLSGILTVSPEAVIVADAAGQVTLFSAGAEAIFGYKAEEVIGREIEYLMPEQYRESQIARLQAFLESADAEARIGQRTEIVGRRKSGEAFAALASLSKLETPGGTVFTTILRDVSLEKAAQEELIAAKLKAESASQAKSRFVASMSHELRTPLNAIIGFSELLMSEVGSEVPAEKRAEYAADINKSGKHLLSVINDILDISRIEAGKVTLDEDRVSVGDVIDSVRRMVQAQADAMEIALTWKADADVPCVLADRRVLLQTVLNLASNAVKFTDPGGSVDMRARVGRDGGVEIAVSDTGIGMRPEDVARVGEPFLQVDGRLSRKFEGTGLGLVIAKRQIEMHGGRLAIDSEIEKGTTMTVCLPATRNLDGGSAVAVA
jgi:two-component system, sensor histidine kinase